MSNQPAARDELAYQIRTLLCRGTQADREELSRLAAGLRLRELEALPAELVAKIERAVIS
jgi:hypothetical protein